MYEGLTDNKNAEKWTEQVVIQTFTEILNQAKTKPAYLLLHAIIDYITYDQWEYLIDKFKDNQTVFRLHKEILQTCENNITDGMINGTIKETASIFLLKCKYGYQDKQVVEVEHKGSIAVNFQFPEQDTDQ